MNNDWTKNIKERMESHEMAEPKGLWQNLESQMRDFEAVPRKQSTKPLVLWLRRCGVAAAIAILSAIGYKALHTSDIDISSAIPDDIVAKAPSSCGSPAQMATGADEPHASANVHVAMLLARAASQRSFASSHDTPITANAATQKTDAEATGGDAETAAESRPSAAENTANASTTPRHYGNVSANTGNDYPLLAENRRQAYRNHTTALSISASGLQLSNNSNGIPDRVLSSGLTYNNRYFTVNNAAAAYSNIPLHHKMPVNVSLKAKFGITNRLFAEGGISYSLLRSDGDDMSAQVTQDLHYLGIPVNFGFVVWQNKRIRVYTYAGGEMQKLVSGKLKSTYKVESPLTESTNLCEKKLQWSVGAGAGIDVGILPTLSIFAEPGVKYYFDNGSQIDNIYKEKPTNFNLQLGLRFDL